jgi:hypothetical protein
MIEQSLDERVPAPEDKQVNFVSPTWKGVMRLPESQIKEAIFHPDPDIRDRATNYFAKAYSPDPAIMPLVIRAVEMHGRQNAYRQIGLSRDLRQTEDTIAWVVRELNDERCGQYENYAYNLSMVLVQADAALLSPREAAVLEARFFLPDLRAAFTERLRMLSWDAPTCWRRLEEFCEEGKDKRYTNEVNLGHARSIVEALARHGQDCEAKVRAVLSQKVDDYHHHPLKWLEPLVVRLAGQVHLEAAIPLIVAKLLEDAGDLGNQECAEALTRIGTPAVLEAVAEAFPRAEHSFRLYATEPMEHIHSDLAVEKCLHLLGQEKEDGVRLNLAHALLSHFAQEGIEATRRLLLGGPLGFEGRGLRSYLLETCTIMGERFPEYDEWLAAEKAEKEEHWRRVKELKGDPQGLLLYALEKLTGKKAADVPRATPPRPPAARLALPRKLEVSRKVGRNDPCPCGSGKKFKNCCMRK